MKAAIIAIFLAILLLKPITQAKASTLCPDGYGYDSNGDGKITAEDSDPGTVGIDTSSPSDTYTEAVLQALKESPGFIDTQNINYMMSIMSSCKREKDFPRIRVDTGNLSCLKNIGLPEIMRATAYSEITGITRKFECVGWAKSVFSYKKNRGSGFAWIDPVTAIHNPAFDRDFRRVFTNDASQLKAGVFVIWPPNQYTSVGHIAYVVAVNPEKKRFYTTEANFLSHGEVAILEHTFKSDTIYGYLEFK